MDIEITNELKTIALLSGFVRELSEGKKPYEELNYEYAERIVKLFSQPVVSGQSEQLHLCPVCNEKAGKSYLLSKLPTICQKCDHAWNRA